jgi:hypothetical protein
LAAFAKRAGLTASPTVSGVALRRDALVITKSLGGGARPKTTALQTRLSSQTRTTTSATMEGVAVKKDTEAITCALGGGTRKTALPALTKAPRRAAFQTSTAMLRIFLKIPTSARTEHLIGGAETLTALTEKTCRTIGILRTRRRGTQAGDQKKHEAAQDREAMQPSPSVVSLL